MILIKLKELLDEYDMNISDVSDGTGLSRSTLTPLVKTPDDVKGLNVETLNTLCDFFGIRLDELIEFIPNDKKYFIKNYWISDFYTTYYFLITKKVGNKERDSIIKIDVNSFSFNEKIGFYAKSNIEFLSKENAIEFLEKQQIHDEKATKLEEVNFPNKNIFENDVSLQSNENIEKLTVLFAKYIEPNLNKVNFLSKLTSETKLDFLEFNWSFLIKRKKVKHILLYNLKDGSIKIKELDDDFNNNFI